MGFILTYDKRRRPRERLYFEKEQKKRGWTLVSESAQASVLLRVRRGRLQQTDPARARSRVNRRFFQGVACFEGSDPWRFWRHQADAFLRWIAAPLRAAEESSRCCFQPNDGGFCRDVFVFPWMPVASENTQTPGAGILHTVAHTRHIFFLRSTQHKRYYLNFCRATPVGQRTFWFIT